MSRQDKISQFISQTSTYYFMPPDDMTVNGKLYEIMQFITENKDLTPHEHTGIRNAFWNCMRLFLEKNNLVNPKN